MTPVGLTDIDKLTHSVHNTVSGICSYPLCFLQEWGRRAARYSRQRKKSKKRKEKSAVTDNIMTESEVSAREHGSYTIQMSCGYKIPELTNFSKSNI